VRRDWLEIDLLRWQVHFLGDPLELFFYQLVSHLAIGLQEEKATNIVILTPFSVA